MAKNIIGDQICGEIQSFFLEGVFPKEWNYTHICLIPKKPNAQKMSDLRPISLCSVMYKAISKILVKRLQPILSELVSPNQSAFVSERLISDNILVAHEVVHSLRTHPKISGEYMAIKSNMSKAYDRVEWNYLEALLSALGFHQNWINWVMFCVTSVSYSVLINDQPHGLIIPKRGLRQGDPLSPFLFVLCTEGLSHLLVQAEQDGRIQGLQFLEEGPSIHHLLFADDSLFMCKAVVEQSEELKRILRQYEDATGQRVNPEKSSITFGSRVEEEGKLVIKSTLGIHNEGGMGTYLGLPECFSGSKIEMLDYIREKLKARMSGWFARTLSMGGKEILLKAVALAMPVYAMSIFKLPKATCGALTSAMADFWWNSMEEKKKIHWLSWDKLCLSKENGGLGFRDIECFNQALLAKQAWRLLQFPESLCAKIVRSRYYTNGEFLKAEKGVRPSYAWTSILFGRELLVKGMEKLIGNGRSINVWSDMWLDDGRPRIPLMKNVFTNIDLKVSNLIDHPNSRWSLQILNEMFYKSDVDSIIKKKVIASQEDYWVWNHTRSGEYTAKSGYWLASREKHHKLIAEASAKPSINDLLQQVWNLQAPLKIRNFLWKALSNAIPVADLLTRRGVKLDSRCQICGLEGESVNHVLFRCTVARQMWAVSNLPWPEEGFHPESIFPNFSYVLRTIQVENIPILARRSIPWVFWYIWKNRNQFLFEGNHFQANDAMIKVWEESNDWFIAQQVDRDEEQIHHNMTALKDIKWRRPPRGWLKCNVGHSWKQDKPYGGGGWVLRDAEGRVLLHSRRAFNSNVPKLDFNLQVLLWAVECMKTHHVKKVIFAAQDCEIFGAILRPAAWPNFKPQAVAMALALRPIEEWRIEVENHKSNMGAFRIAQSVTLAARIQSYVASGYPLWLLDLFKEEAMGQVS